MGCADLHSFSQFLCISLLTMLPIILPWLSTCLPIYVSVLSVCSSIYPSIHPSVRPSVCLSVRPSFHLSVYLLLLTYVRYRLIEVETSTSKIADRGCKGNLFTVLLAVVILRCCLSHNFSALKNQ
jgi:hypothetical protein